MKSREDIEKIIVFLKEYRDRLISNRGSFGFTDHDVEALNEYAIQSLESKIAVMEWCGGISTDFDVFLSTLGYKP